MAIALAPGVVSQRRYQIRALHATWPNERRGSIIRLMKTELGPVVNPLRLLTLSHRHPRRPRRRHGEAGKPVPRMIAEAGVAIGPRITPRRFSTTIAALVEVQTRTRMGYSVGRSRSQIRRTLMTRTVRIPGGLLIPSGDGTCRRVGTYWLLTGSISMSGSGQFTSTLVPVFFFDF